MCISWKCTNSTTPIDSVGSHILTIQMLSIAWPDVLHFHLHISVRCKSRCCPRLTGQDFQIWRLFNNDVGKQERLPSHTGWADDLIGMNVNQTRRQDHRMRACPPTKNNTEEVEKMGRKKERALITNTGERSTLGPVNNFSSAHGGKNDIKQRNCTNHLKRCRWEGGFLVCRQFSH